MNAHYQSASQSIRPMGKILPLRLYPKTKQKIQGNLKAQQTLEIPLQTPPGKHSRTSIFRFSGSGKGLDERNRRRL
jgi:hypothetical protein